MGLKVSGFNATRGSLTDALTPIEQELELISKTPLEPSALPEGKKAMRARAEVLDKQIEVLTSHLQSPDPKVRDSATTLLEVAKRERLRLEDGLLTWMVDDLSRTKGSGNVAPTLASPEMAAVTALLGGIVTDAELHHAMQVLAPMAGQNLTDAYFAPKIETTDQHFDKLRKKTSGAAMKVAGLRVGPAMGGFLATSAIRSLGSPALAFFTAALAIRMGISSGKYLATNEIQRVRFETGMNRLEGEVDHDLARIAERASSGQPFSKKTGDELKSAAKNEAALVSYLTTRRKETFAGRDVSAGEKQAIAAFESYAKALGSAGDEASISAARAAVGSATKGVALASLPSLPELAPHGSDAGKVGAAFGEMMSQYGRLMLGVSNPPLLRFSQQIQAKGGELGAGELSYLKMLVGKEPSLGEVLALSPMFASGKLDPKALWPEGATVQLGAGNTVDQATVGDLLKGLGSRDEGERMSWWGKVVHTAAPIIGSVIGAGIMAFVPAAGLLLYGGAFAGTLLAEKAGHAAGDYLTNRGNAQRAMSGVDVAMAASSEFAIGVAGLAGAKGVTSGGASEVAGKLRAEAGTVDALLGSVKGSVDAITARRAAIQAGPEAELLDRELAIHAELRAPIYGRLAEVSAALKGAAQGTDVGAMRATFAEARASLFELMPAMALEVLIAQASPELSMAHGVYFRAKRELAEAIKANAKDEVLAPIIATMAGTYANIPRKQRPDDDALDKWAKKAKDKPENLADRSAVAGLITPQWFKELEASRIETLSVTDDRAGEIGQEVMNALWTQVYGKLGLTSGQDVPELGSLRVDRTPLADGSGFSEVTLSGKVKGGGKFEMKLDALGQPSTDLSTLHIDLGEKILGKMVAAAAVDQVAAATGAPASLGKVKLLDQTDAGYRFSVQVNGQARIATIGADGLVAPTFLSSVA